jgi:hypothetical protein
VTAGVVRRRIGVSLAELLREKASNPFFSGMVRGAGYSAFQRVCVEGCAVVFWIELHGGFVGRRVICSSLLIFQEMLEVFWDLMTAN